MPEILPALANLRTPRHRMSRGVTVDAWQRVFAAVDEKTAKIAFYWSGVLKVGVIGASTI